jgi:hypothetical protein
LTGWQATTAQAWRGKALVYVAHDTSTFSYSSLKHTTGLGPINQIDAARGIHCHSALVLQPDGVVLGLLLPASFTVAFESFCPPSSHGSS